MPRAPSPAAPRLNARKPAAEAGPAAAFAAALDGLAPCGAHVAAALSGGPDSTALLHLLHRWAGETGRHVTALVVDHGLRPDSAAEAALAAERARALGTDAVVLTRAGGKPAAGLQETARAARYALMLGWCREHGVKDLFLGHHLDDQAATVLMRLRRGSGLDGLAAMRPGSERGGVRLLRPLLAVRRGELRDWLAARGAPWIEDPSNDSPDFERNRLDRLLAELDEDGALTARLARLARRSERAAAALDRAADEAFARLCPGGPADMLEIDLAGWRALPDEIALRVLDRAIAAVAGERPPLGRLEDAMARLTDQRRVTVGGAVLACRRSMLAVTREGPRRAGG